MKRIYRDESRKKLGGICAGLGEILDIDPTIIRLAAVFLCIVSCVWPLALTYGIGWIIIPDKSDLPEDSSAQAEQPKP